MAILCSVTQARKVGGEWASDAARLSSAMRLSDGDCEGVKLIEQQCMVFGGIGGKGFPGELNQRRITCLVTGGRGRDKPMAFDNAAKILVCHGDGVVETIEQDSVGGF